MTGHLPLPSSDALDIKPWQAPSKPSRDGRIHHLVQQESQSSPPVRQHTQPDQFNTR